MHESPEGYGQGPYPNQPQGQGGHPPPYPGQGGASPYPGPGGQQPPYGAPQGTPWGQQGGGGFGPPPGPGGWGPPPGPPRKNSGPIVVVTIIAVLVLLGGGGAIAWALSSGGGKPTPVAESTSPETVPSYPTTIPSPGDTALPSPTSSSTYDESMFVQAGDCVKITGKAPDLAMHKADCGSAPYKVLKRFSGTSDKTKCHRVSGYTTAFWAKSRKYSFMSYVLCLKHQ